MDRANIRQKKTGRPVRFELTDQTRQALETVEERYRGIGVSEPSAMHGRDDEDEERQRQEREQAGLTPSERLYGKPVRRTASGFPDRRSQRRTGRVVQMPLRVRPRIRAIIDIIIERDGLPSFVELFEIALCLYLKKNGEVDPSLLPSDDELARRYDMERRLRDAW